MKWFYVVIIAVLNFILQSTVLQTIRIFDVSINTSLILIVFLALVSSNRNAMTAAAVCGLLQDAYYTWAIGVNLFIYLALAILIDMIDESVFKDNTKTPLILIVSSTIAYHVIYTGFMFLLRLPIDWHVMPVKIVVECLLNGFVGVILYKHFVKKTIGYTLR